MRDGLGAKCNETFKEFFFLVLVQMLKREFRYIFCVFILRELETRIARFEISIEP